MIKYLGCVWCVATVLEGERQGGKAQSSESRIIVVGELKNKCEIGLKSLTGSFQSGNSKNASNQKQSAKSI